MLDVKYPHSHGLDGKVHKIEIMRALEIEDNGVKRYTIYGEEGDNTLVFDIVFSPEKGDWIKVPHKSGKLFAKKVDVTDEMREKLEGKKITNNEELDYSFTETKRREVPKTRSTPPVSPAGFDDGTKEQVNAYRDPRNDNYYIKLSDAVKLKYVTEEDAKKRGEKKKIRYADDVLAAKYYLVSDRQLEFIRTHYYIFCQDFKFMQERADGSVEKLEFKEKPQVRTSSDDTIKPVIYDSTLDPMNIMVNSVDENIEVIIDKDFVSDIKKMIEDMHPTGKLVDDLTKVYNMICGYFGTVAVRDESKDVGGISHVTLSSLKGKHQATEVERTIAAYTLLRELYKEAKTDVSLVLMPQEAESEVGSFILLDREKATYPMRHMVFDVNNPLSFEFKARSATAIGLYGLTDEECEDLLNGIGCEPATIFEVFDKSYSDMENKKTFGYTGGRRR